MEKDHRRTNCRHAGFRQKEKDLEGHIPQGKRHQRLSGLCIRKQEIQKEGTHHRRGLSQKENGDDPTYPEKQVPLCKGASLQDRLCRKTGIRKIQRRETGEDEVSNSSNSLIKLL